MDENNPNIPANENSPYTPIQVANQDVINAICNSRRGWGASVLPHSVNPSCGWGLTDFQRLISSCIMEKRGLKYVDMLKDRRKECDGKSVAEVLSGEIGNPISLAVTGMQKQYFPYLINAPTGSGKSTFVLTELADLAAQANRKILICSNRLALYEQTKRQICKEKNIRYNASNPDREYHVFGNIVLFTYQSILYHWNELDAIFGNGSPAFIVFDEVHFFGADATINVNTEEILCHLMMRFPYARRIYMSATPDDVKEIISAFEYWYTYIVPGNSNIPFDELGTCTIREYYFPPRYDHIVLHFFKDWGQITSLIKRENDDSKWLIFVNSVTHGKTVGGEMKKELFDFVTAKDKKSHVMKDLIYRESFEKKVLIGTSVIDNGINIKDDALKNIVIDFFNKTEFIQMLGRKRCQPGERVNVYVRIPTIKEVQGYRKTLIKQKTLLEQLQMNPFWFLCTHWGELTQEDQKLVRVSYVNNNEIEVNANIFAWNQLSIQDAWYENLETEMKRDQNAYMNYVRGWLGMSDNQEYTPPDPLDSDKKELPDLVKKYLDLQLGKLIEEHRDGIISMEEAKSLVNEIITTLNEARVPLSRLGIRRDRKTDRTLANLRALLEECSIPCEITKSGKMYLFTPKK